LAWAYLLLGAGTGMSPFSMSTLRLPPPIVHEGIVAPWPFAKWIVMIMMWWVMMMAMMLPSAAPTVLLHTKVNRYAQATGTMGSGPISTTIFIAGYLVCWLGFSVLATALQWRLEQSQLLHAMMMWSTNVWLTGGLLVAAGAYQLSPFKMVCLKKCRSPASYLSTHWRTGRDGAFYMGLEHGGYCLGCCWFLMALLFVGGVMNLFWIAGLSVLVLAEKFAPFGVRLASAIGALLATIGLYLIVTSFLNVHLV
jgi:predicted metal-binding membrane protein